MKFQILWLAQQQEVKFTNLIIIVTTKSRCSKIYRLYGSIFKKMLMIILFRSNILWKSFGP